MVTAKPLTLTRRQAVRLVLRHQGLDRRNAFGQGPAATKRAIRQLGYVQIDTISVIERAHHHVLKSRVANYAATMLDKLLQDRQVFEYWFHAAAYLPIEHYRFFLPVMARHRQRTLKNLADPRLEQAVLRRIRDEGPLGARDFDNESGAAKESGWWNWKPAKMALERLFLCGELMVHSRKGFQKIYDLRERILPAGLDTRSPTAEEWADFLLDTMLTSAGLASFEEITYLRSTQKRVLHPVSWMNAVKTRLDERVAAGDLVNLRVDKEHYFAKAASVANLPTRLGGRSVIILSPFDNLIIQRKRTRKLFNFDYQLECYVPAPRRRFGYFSLPLLYQGRFIGQTDLKADRKNAVLRVKRLHLDPAHRQREPELQAALLNFATWNGCDAVDMSPANS